MEGQRSCLVMLTEADFLLSDESGVINGALVPVYGRA